MKTVLKILAVLIVLLVVAVVALVLLFDPNALKPRIEAMAREKGIALDIHGDLGWQFWPSVGIEINDLSLAHVEAPEDILAELDRASLLVATRPLFNRELMVEHVQVDGARVNLVVDESGAGNWEAFMPEVEGGEGVPENLSAEERARAEAKASERTPSAPSAEEQNSDSEVPEALSLAVDDVSFTNIVLSYHDQSTGTEMEAVLARLNLSQVNLKGDPIGVNLDWQASIRHTEGEAESPLVVAGSMNTRVTVAEDFKQFSLPSTTLALRVGPPENETRLKLKVNVSASMQGTGLSYNGNLALEPFNLKQLLASLNQSAPATSLETALTQLAFSTDFVGTPNTLTLSALQLQVDNTRLDGEVAIRDISKQALMVTLTGDAINVDHYLPPADEEAEATPASTEPLIPLELVRGLNAQVRLNLGSLIVGDLSLANLRLRLTAVDGLVELSEVSADAYEGKLTSRAQLDGRGDTALIDFNASVQGFQLAPVMRDLELDDKVQFAGSLQLEAQGQTRGVYLDALMQALSVDAEFSGAEVTMAPINVEKYFCQAVTLMRDEEVAEGEEPAEAKTWPEFTNMQPLAGSIRMRNEVITIESFEASVEALILGVKGNINLADDAYDLKLPLRLVEKTTSENGCTVSSNYWLDRSLELLRCRGSLSEMAPLGDCRIDGRGLESMAKDYAGERIQRELLRKLGGDKNEGEEGDAAEGSSTEKAVEGLLNQFLRPKKDDNKTTSPQDE